MFQATIKGPTKYATNEIVSDCEKNARTVWALLAKDQEFKGLAA